MIMHIVKLNGNPNNTSPRIKTAIQILGDKIPQSNPDCPFCNYYLSRQDTDIVQKKSGKKKSTTLFDNIA